MAQKQKISRSSQHEPSTQPRAVLARGGRIVRRIAQGTLFAAGLAAAQIGLAETDPRFPVFSPTLVDRLHEPISRYHE